MRSVFVFVFALIITSCAQIVSPTGGPKDTEPPKALKYFPDSASLNFKGHQFSIEFNEYVQLSNINEQLVVSPPLKKQPEVKVKNKILTVSFDDTLRENTTYTFNFGGAIKDITEQNADADFRYIFSTGDYLDSLSLSGKVLLAEDHSPVAGAMVILYDNLQDSTPYKKTPTYFAKTNKEGMYTLYNLKEGNYKIFCLKDLNANYLFDSNEEMIAFKQDPFKLSKNDSIDLFAFNETPEKLFLKKSTVAGYGHLLFVFNKPVGSINLTTPYAAYKKQWYLTEYNKDRDSVHVWLHDAGDPDSLSVTVYHEQEIIDTLFFNLFKKEDVLNPKRGKGEALKLSVRSNASNNPNFDLNQPLLLEFNHPVKMFEEIVFTTNDSLQAATCDLRIKENVPYKRVYELACMKTEVKGQGMPLINELKFEEAKEYQYFLPPAMVTDVFGMSNDTIWLKFKTKEEKYYGSLFVNLSGEVKAGDILQLVNSKGFVIKQRVLKGAGVEVFKYLEPGYCRVRLIKDENNNGKWDTGKYLVGKQPEKVVYAKDAVTIRANWDQEVEWLLN